MKNKGKSKTKKQKKQELAVEELKGQLIRTLADYDNLQKRTDKEREDLRKVLSAHFVSKLLPVLDMLEDAQEHLKDSGLAIAIKELYEVLDSEGVKKIEAKKGMMFDEDLHEAVETVDKGGKSGEIIKVVLTGYLIGDKLIRPAKVVVTRKEK